MKTKRLFSMLILFVILPVTTLADVWQDPETKVNYEYTVGKSEASVKKTSGITGVIAILSSFSVDGNEYAVTSIGFGAFENCRGLTSVTIPSSVTSIGHYAFSFCIGLTSVAIPSSVTNIGNYAFDNCLSLTSVTIPSSVTSIGILAFHNCKSLTSVTIPEGVTSIGESAFENCRGLTSVTIPSSVTSIEYAAFAGCTGLNSIKVESGNTVYDSRNNCHAIIKTASNTLIQGCNNTVIPSNVTSIDQYAFDGCSGLTSVTIPEGVTKIVESAFRDCGGLTSIIVESGNTVYDSRNNCNAIIETASNTLIHGCNNTVIPSSVTSISNYAFYNCKSLNSVTIPEGVTNIGRDAFSGTPWYNSYYNNAENGLFYIDDILFGYKGKKPTGDITIKDGTRIIAGGAFLSCSGMTSLTIPSSVTSIGYQAFYGCSGLTSVTIPSSVTSIGWFAFNNCTGLTSMTIPSSVTSIGVGAFSRCSSLTSVTIQEGVTSIGRQTFEYCSSLTSVTIPSSMTSIGFYAFQRCSGLTAVYITDIAAWCGIEFDYSNANPLSYAKHLYLNGEEVKGLNIPEGVINIRDRAFSGCTGLTSVTIPSSVTTIGDAAFSGCSGLTSVTIPNSVTSIGNYAFSGCSGLTSVTIPSSVTSIGYAAFAGCTGLTSVTSFIQEPFEIISNTFNEAYSAILYVPKGTKEKYEVKAGWKNFTNIVEMAGLEPINEDDSVDYGDGGGINDKTDLNGTVVNNMFYSIDSDAGGYSAKEGCIVITKETSDDKIQLINDMNINDEKLNKNFTGIILLLSAGKGTIKVNAQTTGGMTLKVKIGDAEPKVLKLDGKQKVTFPYNVTKTTFVYIYASYIGAASVRGAAEVPSLKIYGIEVKQDSGTPTGVSETPLLNNNVENDSYYDLQGRRILAQPKKKGVYVRQGRKVVVRW